MISVSQIDNHIVIYVDADIVNTSKKVFDLNRLASVIQSQYREVYHTFVGKYAIDLQIRFVVLSNIHQCSKYKVLFQIADEVSGNNPAEADFKGLRIKLNKHHLPDILEMRNKRTLAHELGHLLGWDHPHAKAQYESVNLSAHVLEQQMTEEERKHNLMSQTWYVQRAGISLDYAMQICEKQIDLLLLNYRSKTLNRNDHLKRFLFWNKLR